MIYNMKYYENMYSQCNGMMGLWSDSSAEMLGVMMPAFAKRPCGLLARCAGAV